MNIYIFRTMHVIEVRIRLEGDERLHAFIILAPSGEHERRFQAIALPEMRSVSFKIIEV